VGRERYTQKVFHFWAKFEKGELYYIDTKVVWDVDLAKLMVGDGYDKLVLYDSWMVCDGTKAATYSYLDSYPDGITRPETISILHQNPTYVTYGGLDRAGIHDPVCPRELPYIGKLKWIQSGALSRALLKIRNEKHENYGNGVFGATVDVGGVKCISNDLSGKDTYTSSAGTETEVSRVDLGAIYTIAHMHMRVRHFIDVATAGSFAKCYISEDGTTWTEIYDSGDLPTTEADTYIDKDNQKFRYVRWTVNSASTAATVTLRVYPYFFWVAK